MFNKIPDQHQQTLKNLGQKYMRKLTELSREDNAKAIETLKKNGIKILPPPDESTLKDYYKVGETARSSLVDKFYSKNLLEQVESALMDFRLNKGEE
jgi:TRAP-type C4-dicarboxylate transport system substrate-binding protein